MRVCLWLRIWCALAALAVHAAAAPGPGIVALYYYRAVQTATPTPLVVTYTGDGDAATRAAPMLRFGGPLHQYAPPAWAYVELPGNRDLTVWFSDSAAAKFTLPQPGVFQIANGTTTTLQTFDRACPAKCSLHGSCIESTQRCHCHRPWTNAACDGRTDCSGTAAAKPRAAPYSVDSTVTNAADCCAACQGAPRCQIAVFNAKAMTCGLFNQTFSVLVEAAGFWTTIRPTDVALSASSTDYVVAYVTAVCGFCAVLLALAHFLANSVFARKHPLLDGGGGGGGGYFDDGDAEVLQQIVEELQQEMAQTPHSERPPASLPAASPGSKASLGDHQHKYQYISLLGRGAFSQVFLVAQRRDEAAPPGAAPPPLLAMKVIQCDTDLEMTQAFTEFMHLKQLQPHPHIVELVDMTMSLEDLGLMIHGYEREPIAAAAAAADDGDGEDRGTAVGHKTGFACLVMRYHDEGTLEEGIQQRPAFFSAPAIVVSFLQQLVTALAHSHARDIVHLDLKPGNVLLHGKRRRLVVSDFGIAQVIKSNDPVSNVAGGALFYQAPELLNRRSSKKSDVWSSACVAVAMATQSVGHNTQAMFYVRAAEGFEARFRGDMADRGMPPELVALLLRMLALDATERPTMSDCCVELDAMLHATARPMEQPASVTSLNASSTASPLPEHE
jgi:serine/threonine protein kinase